MDNLSQEESEILESFEKGEWHSKGNLGERKKELQEYARNTFKKKRIDIVISEKDLEIIHTMALEEGIPYQILISNVLHKYVSGRLFVRQGLESNRSTSKQKAA